MSAVCSSTRSATASRSALCCVTESALHDCSFVFQTSIPMAFPPGKKAGRHQEHSAATTPQIKDLLISTQSKPEQDFCPDLEFAPARGVHIACRAEVKHDGTHEADHAGNREIKHSEAQDKTKKGW